MGNLFKVKSNKMSRLGFHPDLLSASRAVPRPLGAASATLCSIFGSKDAMLAHPTLDIMFFFVMHIRTGPLEVQYLCEVMGLRGGGSGGPGEEGYLDRHFFCPLGLCTGQMERGCQPVGPCFLHVPRMARCAERSDGQCLSFTVSHRKLHW